MKAHKAIVVLFIVCFSTAVEARPQTSQDRHYIKILRAGGFNSALTKYVHIWPIYRDRDAEILFYDNSNEQTNHENTELIILLNNNYSHDYPANSSYNCVYKDFYLSCYDPLDKTYNSKIKISDLKIGKKILIGGNISIPYRGARPLLRLGKQ